MSVRCGKRVRFGELPTSVQERFVACLKAPESDPRSPIIAEPLSRIRLAVGIVLLGSLGVLMAYVLFQMSGLLRALDAMSFAYLGMWIVALFCIGYPVFIVIKRNPFGALPFPAGRYLFALDVVDARSSQLRIVPLASAIERRCIHYYVNGSYVNTQFVFRFPDRSVESFILKPMARGDFALRKLDYVRQLAQQAAALADSAQLMALDPFFELRASDATEAGHHQPSS